ncbi:CubicO group peptidase, beta-lactamase class C family [Sporobacter termitidis DSM 10068]|uniref:CubicO group peptidase, beta-lactamase class C family n=1 Tax=Sporobacter termitidis DSM 10068 TaxID=1123282 RepID=A0A1M5YWI7_9FIRM|nr:serine hydrolase domain-containing protein [Sporobacter termitidis]SHI16427.1 CubicO group peptidase, beta-lactamase class C family [Sporobacter termitidis DSM 10068]
MKSSTARKIYIILCIFLTCLASFLLLLFKSDIFFVHKKLISANDGQIADSLDGGVPPLVREIEKVITDGMTRGKIPGLSVVAVSGGETLFKAGYGYADIGIGSPATSGTLFQLGSDSKAFTALGVLKLQKDGVIDLGDSIASYIPWLKFYDGGKEADVTVGELLHHTSGIPARTIARIPESDDESGGAIESTVKTFSGSELDSPPGEKYEYATINYDILGLLIEYASGMRYEDYIQKYVLEPAGLHHTYLYQSQLKPEETAAGYKIGFFSPLYDKAPAYEGNKPAGYIVSSADDMALWLKLQLGTLPAAALSPDLINASHTPDLSVPPFGENMSYAAGWIVCDRDGTEILHSGSNPNFSSFIDFRPSEKLGVAVLCNMNSAYTADIAQSVMALLAHRAAPAGVGDFYGMVDTICVFVLFAAVCADLISFERLIRRLRSFRGDIAAKQPGERHTAKIIFFTALFLAIGAALYELPSLAFGGVTWRYLFVWYPVSGRYALISLCVLVGLTYLNVLLRPLRHRS